MEPTDQEKILELIQKKSGLKKEEIEAKIKAIQDEFKGLLTFTGAAYKLAKDLKIDLSKLKSEPAGPMKIAKLKSGMEDVSVTGRVARIYAPKSFEREGKMGRVCNLDLIDDTGKIRSVLWHRDVEKVETGDIDVGTILEITGAHIKGDQTLELHTGIGSQINVQTETKETFPDVRIETTTIAKIGKDMQDVSVFGRILQLQEVKKFSKEGKEGSLLPMQISDDEAKVRLVVWNPSLSLTRRIKEGMMVRVDHGYVKEGINGIELHVGWQGRVLLNPKNAPEIAKREELVSGGERKFLKDLKEEEMVEVRGMLLDLHNINDFYTCAQCKTKAEKGAQKCPKCGASVQRRLVVNGELDDGTDCLRVVFYGKDAMRLVDLNQLTNETDINLIFETRKPHLLGLELVLQGRLRQNTMIGSNEFVVSDLISKNPDPGKEKEILEKTILK